MHQPHSIVHDGNRLFIMRHESADHHAETPLSERLNLLRYEVTIFPRTNWRLTINRGGRLALHWANLNWWLWKRRVVENRARKTAP